MPGSTISRRAAPVVTNRRRCIAAVCDIKSEAEFEQEVLKVCCCVPLCMSANVGFLVPPCVLGWGRQLHSGLQRCRQYTDPCARACVWASHAG